jgi:protein gp37
MPTKTKIEWCDYVTNPLKAKYESEPYPLNGGHQVIKRGWACVKISEGCANCWASTFNVRLGTGLAYSLPNLEKVQVYVDEGELERLKKINPKGPYKNGRDRALVFPCDMTDLFGSWLSEESIKRVFNAMAETPQMDFMVLTKRPKLMLDFVAGSAPLRNVILGTSIENEQRALARWDAMRQLHLRGWKTGISYEPALGPVDWEPFSFVNWLICGGESGPGARPMNPLWARLARDFAVEYGIPYFFKQWGEWSPVENLMKLGIKTFKRKPVFMGENQYMVWVGKGLAGHELDGEEWRQVP